MTQPGPDYNQVIDQFSGTGPRADIWKGFELFLDTDAYLNLGYSPWYLPHIIGSSQARLADKMTRDIADLRGGHSGRLLDVGCGRGGPTVHFASQGFTVLGVDLVPANIKQARANTIRTGNAGRVEFLIGDACYLPIMPASQDVVTGLDSPVYISDKPGLFGELARVLNSSGVVAIADLVAKPDLNDHATERVSRFTEAWEFAPLITRTEYRDVVKRAGLEVLRVEDISANSTDRFRKWARLFLQFIDTPARNLIEAGLARQDIDLDVVEEQIARTAAALPYLEHITLYAQVA